MESGSLKHEAEPCAYCGGKIKYISAGFMSDSYGCTGCDFRTAAYWDGAEFAFADWNRHMKKRRMEEEALIEKYYIPMARAMGADI
jgi:uncharacterized protein with PIN domain